MVVATTEGSDRALSAALADDWTTGLSEVLDALRIESTFEVLHSGNPGERVVGFVDLTLFDADFDAAIFDAGGCPKFDVELSAHRYVVISF
jgi:hypothetical protein